MRIYGTIVGAILGYLVGRTGGLFVGAVLGYAFDKFCVFKIRSDSFSRKRAAARESMNLPSDAQTAFFLCTFSMLGKLIEVDGHVSKEEMDKIERFIDQHLNLDHQRRVLALKVVRESAQSPLEFRDYAVKFHESFPDRVQLLDTMIDILVQVSAADGNLSREEDKLIRSAALLFGLTEPYYRRIKAKYVAAPEEQQDQRYYEILGCSKDSTDEEVKESYRKLVGFYHPRNAVQSGLPEVLAKYRQEELEQIERAYAAIRVSRGFDDLSG